MIDLTIYFFILLCLFIVSFLANVFFVWYVRALLETLEFFRENLDDLLSLLVGFRDHVESVYGLESFYGDQVLFNLKAHSIQIVEQIREFEEIIDFSEDEEPDEGEDMNEQKNEPDQTNTDDKSAENPEIPSQTRVAF